MGLVHNNSSIVTNGLVLCLDAANRKSYPGSGTTWTDLSGRGSNGSLINGVGYNSANGGSLSFDGANTRVSTTINNLNLTEMSICAWVRFNNISNTPFPTISLKETSNLSRNWWLGLSTNFTFGRSVSGADRAVVSNITPNLNQWYYVVGTNNLTPTLSIYINGILNNVNNLNGTLSTNGTVNWIGSYDNVYPMSGNIAQMSYYNRALTASEIQQNFNALRGRYGI